ncbi:7203_t:CDS:2, partial [Funneliformis caledonium]
NSPTQEFILAENGLVGSPLELEKSALTIRKLDYKQAQKEHEKTNKKVKNLESGVNRLKANQTEVSQLTAQINTLNEDLLTLKERDRLEITHLKTENKGYKKQRDQRPDISHEEYQNLTQQKEQALAEVAKETFPQQNATQIAAKIADLITERDEINESLTAWTATFENQTASQVKTELDNYRQQTEIYITGLTNLGVKNLTDWENTVRDWKNQENQVNDWREKYEKEQTEHGKTADKLKELENQLPIT